ncbi:MAG: SRPBCC family protein [Chitinophagaceae bacterium]|jgi:ASC-1-like (ASCH) protein|nr:SRPBCC family protein [Flavisolibacter sp.]
MPVIKLTTFIAAPVDRVFDLSRSIDFHKYSMNKYGEKPVDGRITGLIEENESVTWSAKHLFKTRRLTVRISKIQKPDLFIDELVKGDFHKLTHEHHFKTIENGTIMIDQFYFEIHYNILGSVLNRIYLTNYLKNLLVERNKSIKEAAESNRWKHYLHQK